MVIRNPREVGCGTQALVSDRRICLQCHSTNQIFIAYLPLCVRSCVLVCYRLVARAKLQNGDVRFFRVRVCEQLHTFGTESPAPTCCRYNHSWSTSVGVCSCVPLALPMDDLHTTNQQWFNLRAKWKRGIEILRLCFLTPVCIISPLSLFHLYRKRVNCKNIIDVSENELSNMSSKSS